MLGGSQAAPRAKIGTPLSRKRKNRPPSGSGLRSSAIVRTPTRSVTPSSAAALGVFEGDRDVVQRLVAEIVRPPQLRVVDGEPRAGDTHRAVRRRQGESDGVPLSTGTGKVDGGRQRVVGREGIDVDRDVDDGAASRDVHVHRAHMVTADHRPLLAAQFDRLPDPDRRHPGAEVPAPGEHGLAAPGRLRHGVGEQSGGLRPILGFDAVGRLFGRELAEHVREPLAHRGHRG